MGDVEQAIGRILRKHPDKHTPLVVDVIDPYSVFQFMASKRRKWYSKQGYRTQAVPYSDLMTCGEYFQ